MLNSAILMGRLVANPELRHTASDIAVTSFTLAVNRPYSRQEGQQQTDFIDIVAWRQTAEFVCKYFHKGQLVAVEGNIRTRTYQDKNGNNRKAFEILANSVHFAEPKRDSYGGNNDENSYNTENVATNDFSGVSQKENNSSYTNGVPSDFEEVISDDDLPF